MSRRHVWLVVLLAAVAGCEPGTTAPNDGPGAAVKVELVSGSEQADTVLATLAQPLAVRVLDADGHPVPGATVSWVAEEGVLSQASTVSDGSGVARATWTLGTRAGRWTATASAVGDPVVFAATVRAGAPVSLTVESDSTPLGIGVRRRIVVAHDGHGNDASAVLALASTDSGVVVASDSGTVRGVAPGEARVIVSGGALVDTARVRVVSPPVLDLGLGHSGEAFPTTDFDLPTEVYGLTLSVRVSGAARLASLTYSVDGGTKTAVTDVYVGSLQTLPLYAVLVATVDIPRGEHRIEVAAMDVAGNVTTASQTVRLHSQAKRYAVTYLGAAGGVDSEPADLNERGDVAGTIVAADGGTRAVLWRDGTVVEVGAGLSASRRGVGVNDARQVTGTVNDGCNRAFLWESGVTKLAPECLGPIGIASDGTVLLQNDRLWRGGTISPFPLGAHSFPHSASINRDGTVLGFSYMCGGGGCAGPTWYIRAPWRASDVASLESGPAFYIDMNERGDMVGSCFGGSATTCNLRLRLSDGTLYSRDWAPRGSAGFVAISNARVAIGVAQGRGFVWERGTLYRIEPTDASWSIGRVYEINDAGQIAAHAVNTASGEKGAVLLTPVP